MGKSKRLAAARKVKDRPHHRRPASPVLTIAVLTTIAALAWPGAIAQASGITLYLKSAGVPNSQMTTVAPTATALPNYDSHRDDGPGLLLKRSSRGVSETDVRKYQLWVSGVTTIEGTATLTIWSATQDFGNDKSGQVDAFLLACTNQGLGTCSSVASAVATSDPWSATGQWARHELEFGTVSYQGANPLVVKLVVNDQSEDDLRFAYDTTSFPSALVVTAPAGGTPTTTNPAPTTTTPPTTTTSIAGPTTTPPTTPTAENPSVGSPPPGPAEEPVKPPLTTPTTVGSAVSSDEGPATGPPDDAGRPPDSDPTDIRSDPVVHSMGESDEADQPMSETPLGWAGSIIDDIELVMPPWAAGLVSSPLVILGFVLEAMTDSGESIFLPSGLLAAGMIWVVVENRVFTPAARREEESEVDPQ